MPFIEMFLGMMTDQYEVATGLQCHVRGLRDSVVVGDSTHAEVVRHDDALVTELEAEQACHDCM